MSPRKCGGGGRRKRRGPRWEEEEAPAQMGVTSELGLNNAKELNTWRSREGHWEAEGTAPRKSERPKGCGAT